MTHDEINELLPGFALGALEADERGEVEAHLSDCREHDDELVALRATLLALGTLADEREPSAQLSAGIARIAVAPAGPVALESAPLDLSRTVPAPRTPRRRSWRVVGGAAAAALIVFVAGWIAGMRLGAEDHYSYLVQAPDGVVLQLSGTSGAEAVTVWMAGLQRLPADQRYQLWAIRDEGWLSIGVCNTNEEGRWLGDFAFTLASDEEIALTIEPAPGSDRPSADPVLRTRF